MPSTIQSTSSFNAGGLVLQRHTCSVEEDGFVEISMTFACLASFLNARILAFRMESAPPLGLPADVAALPLDTGRVYLNAITTTTDKGIGYIEATYVGSSRDQKRRVNVVETRESFSGTGTARATTNLGFNGTVQLPSFQFTETFDYTSETFSVVFSSVGSRGAGLSLFPRTKEIRNYSRAPFQTIGNVTVSPQSGYKEERITTISQTNIGPVVRYRQTVQAVFVQKPRGS